MLNSAWLGWVLAAIGVAVGFASYGWPGVFLGVTIVVFWLLLQFSRALRVMRRAAARPVGTVGNAVMLHVRLKPGLQMMQLLPLSGSLGRRVDDGGPHATLEIFEWADASGDRVRVELQGGRVSRFELLRQPQDHDEDGDQASEQDSDQDRAQPGEAEENHDHDDAPQPARPPAPAP